MTPALLLGALLLAEGAPEVAVRMDSRGGRHVLLLSGVDSTRIEVQRTSAEEITIRLPPGVRLQGSLPAPVGPIASLRMAVEPRTVLRVALRPNTPYEVSREGDLMALVLGAVEASEPASVTALEARTRSLFPERSDETRPGESSVGGARGDAPDRGLSLDTEPGLRLGPLSFSPGIVLQYVLARGSLTESTDSAEWTDYVQALPTLGARVGFLSARLGGFKASYRPRFRRFTSLRELKQVTHELSARLDVPVGGMLHVGAFDQYMRGLLEVENVDPGREYFVNLGRFSHNVYGGYLRFDGGGRLGAEALAGVDDVRFDEATSWFPHREERVEWALRYALGGGQHLDLRYRHARVPRPEERPEAENRSDQVRLTLSGDLLPLVQGDVFVGIHHQRHPNVPSDGRTYTGLIFGAYVRKDFSPQTWLMLGADRGPHLSGFESNGFYGSQTVRTALTVPAGLGLSAHLGAAYRVNDYPLPAAGLDEPRQDRLVSWSAGVGRPVGERAFVRVDYLKERRHSNLAAFESVNEGLSVQVGIGLWTRPPVPPGTRTLQ